MKLQTTETAQGRRARHEDVSKANRARSIEPYSQRQTSCALESPRSSLDRRPTFSIWQRDRTFVCQFKSLQAQRVAAAAWHADKTDKRAETKQSASIAPQTTNDDRLTLLAAQVAMQRQQKTWPHNVVVGTLIHKANEHTRWLSGAFK